MRGEANVGDWHIYRLPAVVGGSNTARPCTYTERRPTDGERARYGRKGDTAWWQTARRREKKIESLLNGDITSACADRLARRAVVFAPRTIHSSGTCSACGRPDSRPSMNPLMTYRNNSIIPVDSMFAGWVDCNGVACNFAPIYEKPNTKTGADELLATRCRRFNDHEIVINRILLEVGMRNSAKSLINNYSKALPTNRIAANATQIYGGLINLFLSSTDLQPASSFIRQFDLEPRNFWAVLEQF